MFLFLEGLVVDHLGLVIRLPTRAISFVIIWEVAGEGWVTSFTIWAVRAFWVIIFWVIISLATTFWLVTISLDLPFLVTTSSRVIAS